MKTRYAIAAGLALGLAAAANAAMIVSSSIEGAGNNAHNANTTRHLVQRVQFDQAFNLNTIGVNASGANFNLYLAQNIGDAANDTFDIVWSSEGNSVAGGFQWVDLDASGTSVDAGEYFLIMTSEETVGPRWRRVFRDAPDTFGVGDSGIALTNLDTITGKSFTSDAGSRIYSVRIDGDVIPAPGAAALFGLAGLTAARRRR